MALSPLNSTHYVDLSSFPFCILAFLTIATFCTSIFCGLTRVCVCMCTQVPRSCLGCPPVSSVFEWEIWLSCASTSTRGAQRKMQARLLQGKSQEALGVKGYWDIKIIITEMKQVSDWTCACVK